MEKPNNIILYVASKLDFSMASHQPPNTFERELLEQIHILSPAKGQGPAAALLGISSGKDLHEWYLG